MAIRKKIEETFRVSRLAFGKYRSDIILVTVLGFLSGLFEAVGIGSIIPLFYLLTDAPILGAEFISRMVRRVFVFLGVDFNPVTLFAFIALLFILKALIQFTARYVNAKTVAKFEEEMRSTLLKKVFRAKWAILLSQKSGYLEGVILYDTERGAFILNSIAGAILVLSTLIMYGGVALSISIPITLISGAIGLVIFFVFKPVFFKIRSFFSELSRAYKEVAHHVAEGLIGAKTIKTMRAEELAWQKVREYFQKFRHIRVKTALFRQSTLSFIEPVGFLFITTLFFWFHKSPTFNIASFAIIIYLVQKMFSFIKLFENHVYSINEAIPHLKAALTYYEKIQDQEEIDSGKKEFEFTNHLEFKNLHFAYSGQKQEVLSGVNFSIKKGEMVGLIGPSGSGKTTLVDLVTRLLEPSRGEILMDGRNINEIALASWRSNVGYVPQDIFLMNDTIENNIKFYNENITSKQMIEAAQAANIYDFIESLPNKFQAVVGERGIQLSGGQRQRIALARALIYSPAILILDEATSALDNESEAMVQKSITRLRGKTTIIVIAHRLTTVMDADKLVVLENGVIAREGKPDDIIKNNS